MNNKEAIEVIESSDAFWLRPTEEEKAALNQAIKAMQTLDEIRRKFDEYAAKKAKLEK